MNYHIENLPICTWRHLCNDLADSDPVKKREKLNNRLLEMDKQIAAIIDSLPAQEKDKEPGVILADGTWCPRYMIKFMLEDLSHIWRLEEYIFDIDHFGEYHYRGRRH